MDDGFFDRVCGFRTPDWQHKSKSDETNPAATLEVWSIKCLPASHVGLIRSNLHVSVSGALGAGWLHVSPQQPSAAPSPPPCCVCVGFGPIRSRLSELTSNSASVVAAARSSDQWIRDQSQDADSLESNANVLSAGCEQADQGPDTRA
ncbi:hypothetical protein E4U43_004787 [Claviceps pusilla]|uniref:Uncharacterized protein n=1 Tax=Claviceps pusilla TaxID=123648 RepID=A0A9P7SWS6_9HYPO|nr:hypothetical protein E4U43_004787 [Claviceps pusilla]